jgi:uncharacterized coiled-coil protein SlyX
LGEVSVKLDASQLRGLERRLNDLEAQLKNGAEILDELAEYTSVLEQRLSELESRLKRM